MHGVARSTVSAAADLGTAQHRSDAGRDAQPRVLHTKFVADVIGYPIPAATGPCHQV